MPDYPIHGSKYFDIKEFVDARTWGVLGVNAAWLVDPRTVRICDLIREKTGVPVTVNNWHMGGNFDSSGFRAKWDNTGGTLSQHRCGRAADIKVKGMIPLRVFQIINENKADFEAVGLTALEDLTYTPTWLHVDCRPRLDGSTGFKIVKP